MKRLAVIAALTLFLGGNSLALAAAKKPGQAPRLRGPQVNAKKIGARAHELTTRVNNDEKAGKLSKDQAKALRDSLKSIVSQITSDVRQNQGGDLTKSQAGELNRQLEESSKAITASEK